MEASVAEEIMKKRRVVKKSESVREQAKKAQNVTPKKRRVRQASKVAGKPVRTIWKLLGRILAPFSFLLAPFRTRPARFIGRLLAKVLLLNYFLNSWRELRKVTWPGWRETMRLTFAVFVFAILFALIISGVDYVLDKIFKALILQ